MRKWIGLAGLALFGLPATALAQGQDMAHEDHAAMNGEVRTEIEAQTEAWEQAINAGNAAAAAAFYIEDGVAMPPGKPAIEGRAAIEEDMAGDLAQMEGMQMSFETTEVAALDGHALESGTYTLDAADGTHLDHGKYITIWVSTDDGWKVARDIWNSDMAPPAGGDAGGQ